MIKNDILKQYKSLLSLKIRYDDLDTLGHVNNKAYLSYLEESRIKYMSEVLKLDLSNLAFDVVVGRIDIRYSAPLYIHENVFVYTRISRIGEKSYDLDCLIAGQNGEKLKEAARATVTMVSVDPKTGKTKANEQSMIESIMNFEIIKPQFSSNISIKS